MQELYSGNDGPCHERNMSLALFPLLGRGVLIQFKKCTLLADSNGMKNIL